jgi:hypothetical protein
LPAAAADYLSDCPVSAAAAVWAVHFAEQQQQQLLLFLLQVWQLVGLLLLLLLLQVVPSSVQKG